MAVRLTVVLPAPIMAANTKATPFSFLFFSFLFLFFAFRWRRRQSIIDYDHLDFRRTISLHFFLLFNATRQLDVFHCASLLYPPLDDSEITDGMYEYLPCNKRWKESHGQGSRRKLDISYLN